VGGVNTSSEPVVRGALLNCFLIVQLCSHSSILNSFFNSFLIVQFVSHYSSLFSMYTCSMFTNTVHIISFLVKVEVRSISPAANYFQIPVYLYCKFTQVTHDFFLVGVGAGAEYVAIGPPRLQFLRHAAG